MKNKTFWFGYLTVFVVMQGYAYVVHQLMLSETYASLSGVFRPEEQIIGMMWMTTVGAILYVFLFCYIFTRCHNSNGLIAGAGFGALMGAFMSIPVAVDQYVVYPLPLSLAAIWLLTGIIGFVLAGVIFAALYKPDNAY